MKRSTSVSGFAVLFRLDFKIQEIAENRIIVIHTAFKAQDLEYYHQFTHFCPGIRLYHPVVQARNYSQTDLLPNISVQFES